MKLSRAKFGERIMVNLIHVGKEEDLVDLGIYWDTKQINDEQGHNNKQSNI